jgi:amino acid transporter
VGALISIIGNLNTIMLTSPRLLYAMAEQGQLPAALAGTHARFRTPHLAIVISAAVMLGFSLGGSFISALTISAAIRLITYAATALALPVLRARAGAPPATFTLPFGRTIAVAAAGFSVFLLAHSTWKEMMLVAGAAVVGLLVHLLWGGSAADR